MDSYDLELYAAFLKMHRLHMVCLNKSLCHLPLSPFLLNVMNSEKNDFYIKAKMVLGAEWCVHICQQLILC